MSIAGTENLEKRWVSVEIDASHPRTSPSRKKTDGWIRQLLSLKSDRVIHQQLSLILPPSEKSEQSFPLSEL